MNPNFLFDFRGFESVPFGCDSTGTGIAPQCSQQNQPVVHRWQLELLWVAGPPCIMHIISCASQRYPQPSRRDHVIFCPVLIRMHTSRSLLVDVYEALWLRSLRLS